MFSKSEVKVLLEITRAGSGNIKALLKSTRLSYSQLYRILRKLEDRGLILREKRGRYFIDRFLADLILELHRRYDLEVVLSKGYFKVLMLLLDKPRSAREISVATGYSYKHVLRLLRKLTLSMAVKYDRGLYYLVDDPKLRMLLEWLGARRGKIVAGKIFRKVPHGVKSEGSLTGFSVFWRWGVEVSLAYDYYVYPPMSIGIEEALIHAWILAETPQERGLIAIFYAKNIDKIDYGRLQKLAEEYSLLEDLVELEAYIRGMDVKRRDLFPPWSEVKEQAKMYSVDLEKLRYPKLSEEFFMILGGKLDREVKAYLFGGACMVLRRLKDGTKDIDLVVQSRSEFEAISEALKRIGYKGYVEFEVIKRKRGKSIEIFEREGYPRIDLYIHRIAGKLVLTESMLRRADVRRYGRLTLYLASNEDIVLLKSVTDRFRDILDIELIVKTLKTRLNWNTILEELTIQEELTQQHFCLSVLETIEALEERLKIKIPIKIKLKRIVNEHMKELLNKIREGNI